MTWMKECSVLLKTYKIPLKFDGQACHCNELQILKFAKNNNIVLFCLHPQNYQQSTTLPPWDDIFTPWKSTAILPIVQYCSFCEMWLHENCVISTLYWIWMLPKKKKKKNLKTYKNKNEVTRSLMVEQDIHNFDYNFTFYSYITLHFMTYKASFTTASAKEATLHTFTIFITVNKHGSICDFRLPQWSRWELHFFVLLCSG